MHTVLHRDECLRVALCGNALVSMFTDAPTEERLEKLLEVQRPHLTGKHIFVTLIDARTRSDFSSAARAKAAEVGAATTPFTLCNLYVVVSGGFRGAATRSALAGVIMLSRKPTPWKVVSTIDEGLAWLHEVGCSVDDAELRACAEALLAPDAR